MVMLCVLPSPAPPTAKRSQSKSVCQKLNSHSGHPSGKHAQIRTFEKNHAARGSPFTIDAYSNMCPCIYSNVGGCAVFTELDYCDLLRILTGECSQGLKGTERKRKALK